MIFRRETDMEVLPGWRENSERVHLSGFMVCVCSGYLFLTRHKIFDRICRGNEVMLWHKAKSVSREVVWVDFGGHTSPGLCKQVWTLTQVGERSPDVGWRAVGCDLG